MIASSRDRQIISRDHSEHPAIFDGATKRWFTYQELLAEVRDLAQALKLPKVRSTHNKSLIFCFASNNFESVLAYLTALEYGHTVCIFDDAVDDNFKAELLRVYNPELIAYAAESTEGSTVWQSDYARIESRVGWWQRQSAESPGSYSPPLHRELALVLPSSISQDRELLVRIAFNSILSNARSVAFALGINETDRAITSLPIHDAYGLSVVSTRLQVGASVVLTEPKLLDDSFWQLAGELECKSMAGSPETHQLLCREKHRIKEMGSLQLLTQAGGRMPREEVDTLSQLMHERGGKLIIMYGHAEATSRMTVLPPERLAEKPGSVGIPVPWGEILIEKEDATLTKEPNLAGQIVYRGPNVMLGYSRGREDLALGDRTFSQLPTRDIGYLDEEGFLFLRPSEQAQQHRE